MAINDIENGDSNLGIRAKLNLLIGHVNTDEVVNLDVVTDLIADSFESVTALTERVTTAEGEVVTLQSRATTLETNVGNLTSAHNALAADYTPFKSATQTALTTDATVTARGMMSAADKSKLNAIEAGANNYIHPTGDGNLHVPATSTTSNGKFLKAGATAGSISWVDIAKADIGLSNVDNTSDANKPLSTAATAALAGKLSAASNLSDLTDATIARVSLGLGTAAQQSINAFAPAAHVGSGGSGAHAAATTSSAGFMSAADKVKLDGVATGATNYTHPTGDGSLHVPVTGTSNNGKFLKAGATAGSAAWATATKSDVGLGNVDNTSDINKPISTATQAALDDKLNTSGNLSDLVDKSASRFNLGLGSAATQAASDFAPASHIGSGGSAHAAANSSVAGFMSAADKSKLDGVATGANNYTHPIGDGNLHVPATGTTNSGRALVAGATAGSISWVQLTKSDVGLGNVDNTSDANKPISSATQTALNAKLDATHAGTGGTAHAEATPSVAGFLSAADKTKLDTVASGANNYVHPSGDGNQHVPATGTANSGKALVAGATAGSAAWTQLTKTHVGLANVDNTSDVNKPISTATQSALDLKLDATHAGTGGSAHALVNTTVAGFMSAADKIKLDGVATGATNYSHPTGDGNLHVPATSTTNNGRFLKAGATAGSISWVAVTKTDVGLGNVDNTADANKPVSTAQQSALDLKTDALGTIVSDWNLASNGGFYNSDASASNAPAATFLAGFVSQRAGQHAAQLAFDLNGTNGAFVRTRYGSVWDSWKPLGDYLGTITNNIQFSNTTQQKINLYNATYGIGVQSSTFYARGASFAFFQGGVHSNTQWDAGVGGILLLAFDGNVIQYKGNDIYHAGSAAGSIKPSIISGAISGNNLVPNGSFEYDLDGWTTGHAGATIATDADVGSGTKCVSLVKNANYGIVSAGMIPVVPGDMYLASAEIKGNVASTVGFYLRIFWYKNDKTASTTAYTDLYSNSAIPSTWTQKPGRAIAPSDARFATVAIYHYTTSTATTLRVDDMVFTRCIESNNIANDIVLYGTPTAPTPAAGTNNTQLATTAFVATAAAGKADSSNPTIQGAITVQTSNLQFPASGLVIQETTHATSVRSSIAIGTGWLMLQDSNGNGTKDFSIYNVSAGASGFNLSAANAVYMPGDVTTGSSITAASTVVATGSLVARGGGAGAEGGQITLGWGNNTTTAISGQGNNTWNIDVNTANDLRIFSVDSGGAVSMPITVQASSGIPSFYVSPRIVADYADLRLLTGNNRGWRLASTSAGTSQGSLVIQGSTDGFVSNFTDAITIDAAGNVIFKDYAVTNRYRANIVDFYSAGAGTNLKTSRIVTGSGYTNHEILNDAYSAATFIAMQINHANGQVNFAAARPIFAGQTPWDTGNFDPNTKANVSGQIFTGTVTVRTNGSTGSINMTSGDGSHPGYAVFCNAAGTRVGFAGYSYGTKLLLMAENGFTGWDFGQVPSVGGSNIWYAGNFDPNTKATLGATANFGDIYANRGDGTGVIYLGNGTRYLYFDGTNYILQTSPLVVGGDVWAAGAKCWTSATFNPATKADLRSMYGGVSYDNVNVDNLTTVLETRFINPAGGGGPSGGGMGYYFGFGGGDNNARGAQLFMAHEDAGGGMAFRTRNTSYTWKPWKKIWSEANLAPAETLISYVDIASAVAYIEVTLPAGYKYFRLLYQGLSSDYSGATNNYLVARFKRGGSFITTGSYYWAAIYSNGVVAPAVWGRSTFDNCMGISSASLPYNSNQFNGSAIIDPGDSLLFPTIKNQSENGTIQHFGNGYLGSVGRIESVQLITITGNITRGRYWLYGVL